MEAFGQLTHGKSGGFPTRSGRMAVYSVRSYPVSSRLSLANYFKVRRHEHWAQSLKVGRTSCPLCSP
jgi:hypothetical protein